jgi:hypothetical protein
MKNMWHETLIFSCLGAYLVGGVLIFSGLGLILFFDNLDLLGWGSGSSLGYLGVSVGLAMNIVAVLGMRLLRNHYPVR